MPLVLRETYVSELRHGSISEVLVARVDPNSSTAIHRRSEGRCTDAVRATPPEILLGTLRHHSLRLRAPLVLRVEDRGDVVTIHSDELAASGDGAHVTAAIEDFQRLIAATYLSLRDERARVDPDMERQWRHLRRWIEERR